MSSKGLASYAALSTFDEKVKEARNYEKALASWFQRRFGAYVLATYDYSGLQENKAPKLMAESSGLVIPDLIVCRNGNSTWVECKWKTNADFYRKTGDLVTGINARHYEHYQKVKRLSGLKVMIMFLHTHENEMRGNEIDLLPEIHHRYDGLKMGRSGMIFWEYGQLKRWCSLDDIFNQKDFA